MRLFDFFSKTLCWNTHFPTFLLSSKQNINTNLQQGGGVFYTLLRVFCFREREICMYQTLQNIKCVCLSPKQAVYDGEELRTDGISSDFFSSACCSGLVGLICCIPLSGPLCYFSFSAQLTPL